MRFVHQGQLLPLIVTLLLASLAAIHAAEKPLYQNDFTQPLGKEWFWGLGTWTAKDGALEFKALRVR